MTEKTFLPAEDGITHVNVYSRGLTTLGRWLSNFAHCPIETEDGPFASIEGYWYGSAGSATIASGMPWGSPRKSWATAATTRASSAR